MAKSTYQPEVIEALAAKFQTRANSIVRSSIILYGLGLAVMGYGGALLAASPYNGPVAAIVGLVIGAAIGFSQGQQKAFALRAQAAQILCQLQTEINTRSKGD